MVKIYKLNDTINHFYLKFQIKHKEIHRSLNITSIKNHLIIFESCLATSQNPRSVKCIPSTVPSHSNLLVIFLPSIKVTPYFSENSFEVYRILGDIY